MRYLLINHVPVARSSIPGRISVGDLWLEDLRAQGQAVANAGGRLIAATPLVDTLQAHAGGSFHMVDVDLAHEPFTHLPLPAYRSLPRFLRVAARLRHRLAEAIADADIVQMGYGGHPVPLGRVAWPIAGELGRPRIWVFDGADPFPRLERDARAAWPVKRQAKLWATRRFERFCRHAVARADLVFAHNQAVVDRFADVWQPERCYAFDRSFVTERWLVDEQTLARREPHLRNGKRPLRLVAAGRQVAIKGTDQLIRAVALAREAGTPIELDVLGTGADLPRFERMVRDLGLDDVVRFLGAVPFGQPLFDAWARCDAVVVTNLTDEISRNVLLALGRGLPLITYRNPGADAMLESADAAWLVPRGDSDALADALQQAHARRDRLAALARHGLVLARRRSLEATHRQRAALAAACVFVEHDAARTAIAEARG
ncbi:MAG: glycosyltransferase [Phycisphaeraceae bacterium]